MAKNKKPDYYSILGITVKANDKQIKNAAIKMLHKYRPDIYKKGDADLKSEAVLEARDTLLDPEKRSKYDRFWLENYNTNQAETNDEKVFKENIASTGTSAAIKTKVREDLTVEKENNNKFFAFFRELQLPKRNVDEKYPFLFRIYNWKTDGMIFLITGVLIPLIALFVLAFAAHMGQAYDGAPAAFKEPLIGMKGNNGKTVDAAPMVFMAINIVSNVIGFMIFWQRDSQVFKKSGFIIFYTYIFVVDIIMIIASIILGLAIPAPSSGDLSDSFAYTIASTWFQIVAELIVLWLAFAQTKNLKQRVLMTLKQNWKMWLITIIIAGVLLFVFMEWVMPAIFSGVPAIEGSSSNEDSLEKMLSSDNAGQRAGYAITLFIFTVLIAPMTEELATRHAIYAGTSNRTIAFFTAALYFGMLHVQGGDVEHIFNYFIGGLFLSGVFSIARGNVTYDTGTHMLYNLISYIVICAEKIPH